MKFGKLRIENFLTIGQAQLDLMDRGICLIQGENEDNTSAVSNGAGKSTIADALCWVLFGTTARGETGDKIVNRTAGKGTKVMIDLHDGDDVWRITRHRKHKTGKNALHVHHLKDATGEVIDHTKGTDKLTQELVVQLVGCSLEIFQSAVYAGQERMPDIPAMTDKQLKMTVEEAAGTTVLEDAYRLALDEVKAIKNKIADINMKIAAKDPMIFHVDANVKQAEENINRWESERKGEITVLSGEAHAKKKEYDEYVTALKACPAEIAIKGEIAAVKAKIDGVKGEQEKLQELITAFNKASIEHAKAKSVTANAYRERCAREKALSTIMMRVGTACGECGKAYCEHDIAAAETIARNACAAAETVHHDAMAAENAVLGIMQGAEKAVEAFKASMTDISASTALYERLSASLREIQQIEVARDNVAKKIRELVDRIRVLKDKVNPHHEQVTSWRAKLADLYDQKADLVEKHKEIEKELENAETVAGIFSPAGARAHILDEVTPFLNDQTAKYLATLTDGNTTATWSTLTKTAKGELRESFSIDVQDATGGDSFGLLSGGEKKKVRIATALALQDLVARRATKPIELFIGDEIDEALDAAGQERLMMVLEEKARERGSVFIISHLDLKDWISQVITVRKKDGFATITEEVS